MPRRRPPTSTREVLIAALLPAWTTDSTSAPAEVVLCNLSVRLNGNSRATRAVAKLKRLRNLGLLDISFSSGFCVATIHSAAPARLKKAVLEGPLKLTPGNAHVQIVEDINEFNAATLSASRRRALPRRSSFASHMNIASAALGPWHKEFCLVRCRNRTKQLRTRRSSSG